MSDDDIYEMNEAIEMAIDAEGDKYEAELTRLRAIEAAARELIEAGDTLKIEGISFAQFNREAMKRHSDAVDELRKALGSTPSK